VETPAQSIPAATPQPQLTWAKYDFVPGTEIIFEDNLEGEQNGEFPSKWDLVDGNFENAHFDGANVIYHIKCNMNGGGGIVPMLKNSKEDYLPEEFTLEFDAYFNEDHGGSYHIYWGDYKNQRSLDKTYPIGKKYIRIYKNSVDGSGIEQNYYPGYKSGMFDKTPKWRHVAISFNKRALKVYLDDARVLNIPNLEYNPTGFSIGKQNVTGVGYIGYTKNFRIAKGAVPLYDKFLTDGKFVTTGIKFDVNKATIKPESMGTINYVVKMMTDHPELKFSVEGHTDSDGEDAANQKLSEARAKSVLEAMVKLGISADRLTSKGHGESKPMAGNDTPEGKAQNRRVEFVKF
jgi:outer membrane protein OmpA-like peptidoglycan-associated protein